MKYARWLGALPCASAVFLAFSCSAPELPPYGAPNSLEGKEAPRPPVTGPGAGTGQCTPDKYVNGTSTVSFKNDIMPLLGDGKGGCSTTNCHGGGTAPKITKDPNETYQSMISYKVQGVLYVNPCAKDKAQGKLACNMRGDQGCGTKMPFAPGVAPAAADLDNIDKWQADGAPLN